MTQGEKVTMRKIELEANEAQKATVAKLMAKGWEPDHPFAKAVPMTLHRAGVRIHIRRDGKCYRGYPGHSSHEHRNTTGRYQYSR
jgi:hypothetical protein